MFSPLPLITNKKLHSKNAFTANLYSLWFDVFSSVSSVTMVSDLQHHPNCSWPAREKSVKAKNPKIENEISYQQLFCCFVSRLRRSFSLVSAKTLFDAITFAVCWMRNVKRLLSGSLTSRMFPKLSCFAIGHGTYFIPVVRHCALYAVKLRNILYSFKWMLWSKRLNFFLIKHAWVAVYFGFTLR